MMDDYKELLKHLDAITSDSSDPHDWMKAALAAQQVIKSTNPALSTAMEKSHDR